MTQNAFDSRRWVLPVVSFVPVLAILFAFSLGPSPRKRLQVVYTAPEVDVTQLTALAQESPAVLDALSEDVEERDTPHRVALIRFLGQSTYQPAAPGLRRLATSLTEREDVRMAALEALKSVDPKGLRDVAQRLGEEAGAVGKAARELTAQLSSG